MSESALRRIDDAVSDAVARGDAPGAVVVAGRHGKVYFEKAFGARAVAPAREEMTVDTVFDLASLTKPIATATSIMILIEEGKIKCSDRAAKFIPEFAASGGGRENITIEQLLTHRAGFAPDDPMELYQGAREAIFAKKYKQKLARSPGEAFVYSDVGFEVLGEIVRIVSGVELDEFARERIFKPLGMNDMGFRRIGRQHSIAESRVAPTERLNSQFLRGVVHDPRARALGGVAGHAGLFGTARDLAKYCIFILGGPARVLRPETAAEMIEMRGGADGNIRGLGWDIETSYSGPRGELYPLGSFGHTGFTGTSMWIDPSTDSFVILLTSALHPDGKGNILKLRRRVATLAALACDGVDWRARTESEEADADSAKIKIPRSHPHAVIPGVDALEMYKFSRIEHSRIALVTNQTGRSRDGVSTLDLCLSKTARDAGVKVIRIFSPEHGIRGIADEKVADGVDAATGLPIVSLYGERKRPRPEDLKDLDAIVVDLQDAGCRFYTYLSTLGYVMEEAAAAGVRVVVLDRPDPVGAARCEGAVADLDKSAFVSYHNIPLRTGMTIGEFARMIHSERIRNCNLGVVPMFRYRRESYYDETGIPWVNPSPNLRSVDAAICYPGLGLLEFTNISVGRGTEKPFEQFGAPWLDGARLAAELTKAAIPGFSFTSVEFTPAASMFKKKSCSGVRVAITDRSAAEPTRLGFEIACRLRDEYKESWDARRFPELLANARIADMFSAAAMPGDIVNEMRSEVSAFEARRAKYLLYPAYAPAVSRRSENK